MLEKGFRETEFPICFRKRIERRRVGKGGIRSNADKKKATTFLQTNLIIMTIN